MIGSWFGRACALALGGALLVPGLVAAQERPRAPDTRAPDAARDAEKDAKAQDEARADEHAMKDEAIGDAVHRAIARDLGDGVEELEVLVTGGTAVITGTVGSLFEKRHAVEVAEATRGVRSVDDRIVVSPDDAPSDEQLSVWIREALAGDPAMAGEAYDFEVKDGIVHLRGGFDGAAEKHMVLCTIAQLRGVRDVKDESTLARSAPVQDAALKQRLEGYYRAFALFEGADLKVDAKQGQVSLTGTVPNARARSVAIESAFFAGAASVNADGLKVEPGSPYAAAPAQPPGAARDALDRTLPAGARRATSDEALRASIDGMLEECPAMKEGGVRAHVAQGRVTLDGEVDSYGIKHGAEEMIWMLGGVRGVDNRITVKAGKPIDDDVLEDRLEDAFDRHALFAERDIDVEVEDGRVTLEGDVGSAWERSLAAAWAGKVAGVTDYEDHLAVKASGDVKSDAAIQAAIERQLFWSPFVSGDDITVSVQDGVATLTGQVGSWAEVQAATKNALEGGARRVVNELTVGEDED